jgi:hypothetical protein
MRIFTTTLIAALAATPALADGPNCERVVSLWSNGQAVDTSTLTFYAHGCDAFQYQDLSEHRIAQLGEHCEIPIYPTDPPLPEDGEQAIVTVLVEQGFTIPARDATILAPPRGVANGASFDRDNLTSMGVSTFDGQHVMRVRSATNGNPVTIRQAGGGTVFSGTVGAGDTFVAVGGPGTYIAQTGSRSITKATGPQSFNDADTVNVPERQGTRSIDRSYTTGPTTGQGGGTGYVAQGGPRTDRCGYPGEAIPGN